jgi:hypothetical protein
MKSNQPWSTTPPGALALTFAASRPSASDGRKSSPEQNAT